MYLGLDLGTSSLKALLVDDDQCVVTEESSPLTVNRPHDGWAEQAPDDWISAAENVLGAMASRVDLSKVKGIGLSGHMHGATMLDAEDHPLWPCILWNDTRSSEQAKSMDREPIWRRVTGNIVFPGFTAPKVQWMREVHPEVFDQIRCVLLPKDYLRLWLTGEKVAEMSDAAGTSWLDTGGRDWSDALLQQSGLTRQVMPRLVEGSDISGELRPALVDRFGFSPGVQVAGGAGDNAASAIGMGVVDGGQAFVSIGTSGVLFAACQGFQPDAPTAVHTFCHALPHTWHQMGVILAASDALNWWAQLVGQEAADLTSQLGPLQAPGRTIFLPYLGGERTPINSATVRGSFVGLDHSVDRESGTRAVLEGVAFALADSRDALAAVGTTIESCIAVGGGSKSQYWIEAVATALNIPLDIPAVGDFGAAFGAARLGMMAATGDTGLASRPPIERQVVPNSELSQAFKDAHGRYREAARHMLELS